jgi:cbb3-type cytochrome oxidase subunit 3
VEPADDSALQSDIWRQWLVVFALLFIAGIAYVVFE